jgi:prepilin-type N-terminal cleavage/methylation domain-containing protein
MSHLVNHPLTSVAHNRSINRVFKRIRISSLQGDYMKKRLSSANANKGFTLIELSIVLVIIGLIVGGVLVGQDLIKAAEIRATVAQVERFNTASNTFRGKYNGLPGDLANPTAFFASVTNGNESEQGDGDGVIDGVSAANTACTAALCISGEAAVYWYMLNNAGMIPEGITANTNYETVNLTPGDTTVPPAKMGKGARIGVMGVSGVNYFAIANFGTSALASGTATFTAGMSPLDALQMDSKMDDGKASSGTVISVAVATALPGTAANGNANPTAHCYDSDDGAYAAASGIRNSLYCNLSIRASF